MTRKIVTWVVVADGAHARIYANDGPGKGLHPALNKTWETKLPEHVRDILTDGRGRNTASPAVSGRHALEPRTDPIRHVSQEFSKTVAEMLGSAAQEKSFDRLILVAPPKSLGDLRAALPKQAEALVTGSLDKDLVKLDDGEINRHLVNDGLLV